MNRYIRLILILCTLAFTPVACDDDEVNKEQTTSTVAFATSVLKTMENVTPLQIPITLNTPAVSDIRITAAVKSENGAKENTHYSFQSKEIVIAKGASIGYFFVDITDDREINPDRIFTIGLVNADGATIADRADECKIVIQSDEGFPQIGFRGTLISTPEENPSLILPVVLSKPYSKPVTFTLVVKEGGTALEGENFSLDEKTYTIAAGDTLVNINVKIINDILINPDRVFGLRLTESTYSQIAEVYQECKVTIQNDDRDAYASFVRTKAEILENEEFVWVPVKINGIYKQPITVTLRGEDGTAKLGTDYDIPNPTLTFEDGKMQDSVKVVILDNEVINSDKKFKLYIGNVDGALRADNDTMMNITIVNDDVNMKTLYDDMLGKWTITQTLEGAKSPLSAAMTISGGDTPAEEDANYLKKFVCRVPGWVWSTEMKFTMNFNAETGEMSVNCGETVMTYDFGSDFGKCNLKFEHGGATTQLSTTHNKNYTKITWDPTVIEAILYDWATDARLDVLHFKMQNVVLTKNK